MNQKGFGLLEIIIVIGIITLLIGGGYLAKNIQTQQTTIETGNDAVQKAKVIQQQSQAQVDQQSKALDQLR